MFATEKYARRGNVLINSVIGKFQKLIDELNTGISHNREVIEQNDREVWLLNSQNQELQENIRRAENVKDRLAALVSE